MSFTTKLRKATREVHSISDALVNAKLLFALSDNAVWAEGLTVFYEIFKFLEEAVKRHPNSHLHRLWQKDMERTESFEKDLEFYLGGDWRLSYVVRDEVAEYLLHLQRLESRNPDLLMAYIYHLYLGLLSGGQILKKKRQIKSKIVSESSDEGYAIMAFDGKLSDVKHFIKQQMEEISHEISDEQKLELIEESKSVFEWNNKIIKTVQGAGWASFFNISIIFIGMIVLFYVFFCLMQTVF